MKIQSAFLVTLVGAVCLAFPVFAQEMGPAVLAKGLFSYQAPAGWTLMNSRLSKFPVAVGAESDGQRPIIYVGITKWPGEMTGYANDVLKDLRAKLSTTIVDQKPFATSAGLEGMRIVVRQAAPKINIQSIFYLFDGGDGNKLMIVAGCALTDATRNTPLFDASVKTFSLE